MPVRPLRLSAAGSSALALAIALAAPARAQTLSYNAPDPIVASGTVTFDRGVTTPGTEVYTVSTATAVLDFEPSDTSGTGVINFQNASTSAVYQSSVGGPAFTILNRIVPTDPTRAVAFNGNVVSNIIDGGGVAARGGSVWFYSPGGIVVGDGAAIDVGNLLLTTGDPTGGTGTIASTTSFALNSAAGEDGIVNILSGATINANNAGSYVAMVAPIVFQAGTVNVNGSAAYVAAEQATLTFAQGLFNINVQVGSSGAGGFPLQHLGTTRFRNVATPSRAYLVAVPANDAITLVIGGTADLGFDVATTVGVENGLIVLGAGFGNVSATPVIDSGYSTPSAEQADIRFDGNSTFNAALVGRARDSAQIVVNADTFFGSDVQLRGGTVAQVGSTGAGTLLDIRGDLTVNAIAPSVASGTAVTGGSASLIVSQGGAATILGDVRVDAQANSILGVAGATGAATGGDARIEASGGNITIGGSATAISTAFSNTEAQGGTAIIQTAAGQTLTIGGQATAEARGAGASENATVGTNFGGDGTGGAAGIRSGGSLQISGAVSVNAGGSGGAQTSLGGSGGTGQGGSATLTTFAGGSLAAGAAFVNATGQGGSAGGSSGGGGFGGTATISGAGAITLASALVTAGATGGNKIGGGAGNAGAARSGAALLQATGAGVVTVTGNARVEGPALGGNVTGGSGAGGSADANNATVFAFNGGRIVLGSADIGAGARGGNALGAGNAGGDAIGLNAAISQSGGGSVAVNGNVFILSSGSGGASSEGMGGAGRGGTSRLSSFDADVTVGGVAALTAQGVGGAGATGGFGVGGTTSLTATTALTRVTGAVSLNSGAFGGAGAAGSGGTGTAGSALIFTAPTGTSATGTITLGSSVTIDTSGVGGSATGAGANGAQGTGGTSLFSSEQGVVTAAGAVQVGSSGTGGAKLDAGPGVSGAGVGGSSSVSAIAGSLTLSNTLLLFSNGTGGQTQSSAGIGRGGSARITAFASTDTPPRAGGTISVAGLSTLTVNAIAGQIANAGSTGTGAAATGGVISIRAATGAVTLAGVSATSTTQSSVGSDPAVSAAQGASATIEAAGGNVTINGTTSVQLFTGGGGAPVTGALRDGGNATGGPIFVGSSAGRTLAFNGAVALSSSAVGGANNGGGDLIAGSGTGGSVNVTAAGVVTFASSLFTDTLGRGGTIVAGGGTGGAGNGGIVNVGASTGTLSVAGNATLTSAGQGGLVGGAGNGGVGTGGTARLSANTAGGSVRIDGAIGVFANGNGAQAGTLGGNGGAGFGGSSPDFTRGAFVEVSGGSMRLGPQVNIAADAFGGGAFGAGVGGAAVGGDVDVFVSNGTLDMGASLQASANAIGGSAVAILDQTGTVVAGGGGGGDATGGEVNVTGATSLAGSANAGRLTIGTANLASTAVAGSGAEGAAGLAGGAGGLGAAGRVDLLAQAGNGVIVVNGFTNIVADGIGGMGGGGGAVNAAGVAGAGGVGGDGIGGGGNTGTASGPDSPFNVGSATLRDVAIAVRGTGGAGGAAAAGGSAGAGGTGSGGDYAMLSRGAPVTAGRVSMLAFGIGGPGGVNGAGVVAAGGLGEGGSTGILASNRFNRTERGSFTAASFQAFSGAGLQAGARAIAGDVMLTVLNADAAIGDVRLAAAGTEARAGTTSQISATGGTFAINTLSTDLTGDFGLFTGANGFIELGTADVGATGTLRFGDGVTPSNVPGEIDVAGDLTLRLGGDFVIEDEIEIDGNLAIEVDGRFQAQAIGAAGSVQLSAGTGIVAQDIVSLGGSVSADSGSGAITVGNIRAADSISLSGTGDVTAGDLTALTSPDSFRGEEVGDVDIEASGAIRLGNISGVSVDINTGTDSSDGPYGDIVTGNIFAEEVEVAGLAAVTVGDVRVEDRFADVIGDNGDFSLVLGAGTSLSAGAISGARLVALGGLGGSVRVGSITTPSSAVIFARDDVAVGAVSTGRGAGDSLLVTNSSTYDNDPLFAVDERNEFGEFEFDPTALAAIVPTRIGGSFIASGAISTGNLLVAANGVINVTALDVTSRILFDSGNAIAGGNVTTPAALALTSSGAISFGSITAADVGLTSRTGAISVGDVTSAAGIALTATGSGGAISTGALRAQGAATLATGGRLGTGIIAVGGALVARGASIVTGAISAADVALTASGGTATLGAITATRNIVVSATGPLTVGGASAGSNIALTSGGAATLTGAATTGAAGRLTIDARGAISTGAIRTGGDTLLIATGSSIAATGPIEAGGSVALLADTGIATGSIAAARGDGAFVYLAATSNRARIADGVFLPTFATDPASAIVQGPVTIGGAVSGGLIRISSSGANRYDGAFDAAQRIRIFAGSAAINANLAAPAIELLVNDIAIAPTAMIGGAATESIALTALSTNAPAVFGGSGAAGDAAGGFTLDAGEIGRLRAGTIGFAQQGFFQAGGAQVIVRDLTLNGAGAGATANLTSATGAFTIRSTGSILVTGAVRLASAAAGNSMVFTAADSFDLATDGGSIGVFGTGGAPAGRLSIDANDISVGTAALLAQGEQTDFADEDAEDVLAAINAPSGQNRPEGFLQAGALDLAASDFIAIQNSGSEATPGGFTAGSLTITARRSDGGQTAEDGVAAIVNGRLTGDGGFVSGADTRGRITFVSQGSQNAPLAGFASISRVNGCALDAAIACGGEDGVLPPAQEAAVVSIATDVQGIVEGALSSAAEGESVTAVPDVRLTTVIDQAGLDTGSLIEEPVASGGNASLWDGDDEEDEDDETSPSVEQRP